MYVSNVAWAILVLKTLFVFLSEIQIYEGALYFNWQPYVTRQQLAYFPFFLSPCIVSCKAPKTKANI